MLHCVTFSHKWKQKCFFLLVFFVHLPIKCLELVLLCVSWHFNDASMIYLPKSAIRIMLCLILHCYIQQWWRRLLFWFLSHHPCQSDVGQRDLRHGCLSRDMVSFLSLENALCLLSSKSGKKRIIYLPISNLLQLLSVWRPFLYLRVQTASNCNETCFSLTLHFPPSYLIHAHHETSASPLLVKTTSSLSSSFFSSVIFVSKPSWVFFLNLWMSSRHKDKNWLLKLYFHLNEDKDWASHYWERRKRGAEGRFLF